MKDVAFGVFLGAVASFLCTVSVAPFSAISYEEQRQDKHACEQDIKRSERCVPIMMWLPEASQ